MLFYSLREEHLYNNIPTILVSNTRIFELKEYFLMTHKIKVNEICFFIFKCEGSNNNIWSTTLLV